MRNDDQGLVANRGQTLRRRARTVLRHPLTLVAAVSFLGYGAYSVSRYRQFLAAGYDLGIFDQAVRAYSRFQAPLVPLKGEDFNVLGDHFHPIIALLAPLYWVWDDPRTLLLAQAALIAASTVPVWRFARRRWSSGVATALTVGYVLGWPLQGMADFDLHEIAFAVPLLAWLLDALDRRRDAELFVAAGLLLLVREDMGAVVLVVGLLRAFQRRPRGRGIALAAAGAGAFLLVVAVVIPAFAGAGYQYWEYSVLGSGAGDAVRTVLTHPWTVLQDFFVPATKTWTLLVLLAPLLLLPLASPVTLVALPILAERFLADRSALWTTEFHYNAPIWVILFVAALDGLRRLELRLVPVHARRTTVAWLAAVLAAVPTVAILPLSPVSSALFPLARAVNGGAWAFSEHMADQRAAVASVPPGTCVTTDDRLAPHLTRTNRVTVPGVDAPAPDYLLLDLTEPEPGNPYPLEKWRDPTTREVLADALAGGYRVVGAFGEVLVLHDDSLAVPRAECAP